MATSTTETNFPDEEVEKFSQKLEMVGLKLRTLEEFVIAVSAPLQAYTDSEKLSRYEYIVSLAKRLKSNLLL